MSLRLQRRFAAALMIAALLVPGAALAASEPAAPPTRAAVPEGVPSKPPAVPAKPPAPGESPGPLPQIKVSREEAIAIARKTFSLPADLLEPNVSIYQNESGGVWNLEFQTSSKRPDRLGIGVQVDAATGEVRGFNRWESNQEALPPISVTREEALEKAKGWMTRLAGAYVDKVEFVETNVPFARYYYYGGPDAANYSYTWRRVEQGYPVLNDQIMVSISSRTGELQQFNLNWRQDAEFARPESILTPTAAAAAYKQQVPLELRYMYFQQPGTDKGEWRLVYRPLLELNPILDQAGRLIGPDGAVLDLTGYQKREPVPAPDTPYKAPAEPLDRDGALAVAQAVSGRTDFPTDFNYSEYGEEQKTRSWSFSWNTRRELEPGEYNTEVRIDPVLGVPLSFHNYSRSEPLKADAEPTVSVAAAQQTAAAFLVANRPDLAGRLVLSPESDAVLLKYRMAGFRPDTHRFSYAVLRYGVPVMGQQVSVEVDVRTGRIRSFWGPGSDAFKEPFPLNFFMAIAPAAAADAYLQAAGLRAAWTTFYQPYPTEKGPSAMPAQPQLVWGLKGELPLAAVDAITGTPLDHQGRDLNELLKRPADIAGHAAEREIELLWLRGILELSGGKFRPDEQATAADLARWLVLARGLRPMPAYDFAGGLGGNVALESRLMALPAAAPFFGAALQAGIFLPEDFTADSDPTAPVSREQMALWSVRAMGYSRVAAMPVSIAMDYGDKAAVGGRYANAVALLSGLGVRAGATERFEPRRSITRGEAAMIIFAVASEGRR